jgi:acetyl esterase/lipase
MMERQMQLFADLQAQAMAGGPRPRHDHAGVTSYYDISYAVVPGFRPLTLDLHRPTESDRRVPILLWVHGGGWSGGMRTMGHATSLVSRGYPVAAIQYRLSGEAKFPAQLHDLKGAVRWLRANADTFALDAEHIVAWGASAGGHLAALLGLTAGDPQLEGEVGGNLDQSSAIQGVIDYFAPTDFLGIYAAPPNRPDPVAGLLGYPPADRADAARLAMPLNYARADAPPFLIVHGDVDPLVPHAHSELLHAALRQAGADSTLVTLPGALHEDPAFWTDATLERITAFLEHSLQPSYTSA